MRILQIHSDGFSYELKRKAINYAESPKNKSYLTEESCLINFIAAESLDEIDLQKGSRIGIDMITKASEEIKEKNIIIYPWVHLTESPAKPGFALNLLINIEKELLERNYDVLRVPFGWYKSFTLNCKGHPLAERLKVIDLSKEIIKKSEITKGEDLTAIQAEEETSSNFYILEPDGNLTEVGNYDFTGFEELRLYVKYETAKDRTAHEPPAHIDLMKNLELVDYEPGSDAGNFRWPPRGLTLKRAVEERVITEMLDYGAHVVQTPLMYDYQHPSLKSYLQRFPSRQYVIHSGDREYFARFSACFGQFLMASESQFSYKQLPLKLFEIAPSYRREQSGELAGMRRPRAFTMPDIHEMVTDETMAKNAILNQLKFVQKLLDELEIDYEVSFRLLRSFFDENLGFIKEIVAIINKPVMLEVFKERYAYFIFKGEWNVVDAQEKAACLSTIQIDVENGKRFNIKYVGKDGKKYNPLILHTSPSGSIERILYGVLEQANKDKKRGKKPHLPLWMTPVQVRLIPIEPSYLNFSQEIAINLDSNGIRNEIDDRNITLNKKIRSAEKLWIPYICVIGQKEKENGMLSIRHREKEVQIEMEINELINEIIERTSFAPRQRLMLPKLISKQAIFSREV